MRNHTGVLELLTDDFLHITWALVAFFFPFSFTLAPLLSVHLFSLYYPVLLFSFTSAYILFSKLACQAHLGPKLTSHALFSSTLFGVSWNNWDIRKLEYNLT